MKWQPIETAPKDTAVLVRYNGHIFMAEKNEDAWHWEMVIPNNMKISLKLYPSHWMELPR